MTHLSLLEKAEYPSWILSQNRSNRLTAQWIIIDGRLSCKWLIQ
jgi:hypothetical protein